MSDQERRDLRRRVSKIVGRQYKTADEKIIARLACDHSEDEYYHYLFGEHEVVGCWQRRVVLARVVWNDEGIWILN